MLPLWKFFLDRRQFSLLVMTALVIIGSYSVIRIPKESAPEVVVPIGIVNTPLRGASASDVEKLVTNKIEDELNNLENLDTLTSTSREGLSVVVAQFTASANIDKSINDLKDAVDRAKPQLPSEADDPVITRVNFAKQPILIISVSADMPASELTKLGEILKSKVKAVDGISDVIVSGVRDREVQVVVRKEALETYNLKLVDVIAARRTIQNYSGGVRHALDDVNACCIAYAARHRANRTSNGDTLSNITGVERGGRVAERRGIVSQTGGLGAEKSTNGIDTGVHQIAATDRYVKRGRILEYPVPSHRDIVSREFDADGGSIGLSGIAVNLVPFYYLIVGGGEYTTRR